MFVVNMLASSLIGLQEKQTFVLFVEILLLLSCSDGVVVYFAQYVQQLFVVDCHQATGTAPSNEDLNTSLKIYHC